MQVYEFKPISSMICIIRWVSNLITWIPKLSATMFATHAFTSLQLCYEGVQSFADGWHSIVWPLNIYVLTNHGHWA